MKNEVKKKAADKAALTIVFVNLFLGVGAGLDNRSL